MMHDDAVKTGRRAKATKATKMLRMAQYGTKHPHAASRVESFREHPTCELVGVYEPDPERRRELEQDERGPYAGVRWFESAAELLEDGSIVGVASEGANDESLDQTEAIIRAGKHCWYDKPPGENWPQWQRVVALAAERGLLIQMGNMLRYHPAFRTVAGWARSGFLGDVFKIRADMSKSSPSKEDYP